MAHSGFLGEGGGVGILNKYVCAAKFNGSSITHSMAKGEKGVWHRALTPSMRHWPGAMLLPPRFSNELCITIVTFSLSRMLYKDGLPFKIKYPDCSTAPAHERSTSCDCITVGVGQFQYLEYNFFYIIVYLLKSLSILKNTSRHFEML